jgi:hypothetical protein
MISLLKNKPLYLGHEHNGVQYIGLRDVLSVLKHNEAQALRYGQKERADAFMELAIHFEGLQWTPTP